jgi:hypothetical protein
VRHEQLMVNRKNVAKGMEQVLLERGLLRPGMHGDQMRAVLRDQPDFKGQTSVLQEMAEARGHRVVYFPKFHAELSALEPCFRSSKRTVVHKGILTKEQLRKAVMPALRAIPIATVRAYFDKCKHFMAEYRKRLDYHDAKAHLKATEKERIAERAEKERQLQQSGDAVDVTMRDTDSTAESKSKAKSKAKGKASSVAKGRHADTEAERSHKGDPKGAGNATAPAKSKAKAQKGQRQTGNTIADGPERRRS